MGGGALTQLFMKYRIRVYLLNLCVHIKTVLTVSVCRMEVIKPNFNCCPKKSKDPGAQLREGLCVVLNNNEEI